MKGKRGRRVDKVFGEVFPVTEAVFLLMLRSAASCTLVLQLNREQKVKGNLSGYHNS